MNKARVAGAFYVVTFVTGIFALMVRGPAGSAAALAAAASYVGVTLLFYVLFKPVDPRISLLAAAISLAGIAAGPLRVVSVSPLAFFGFYCLLIAYLIFRSTMPRVLAPLMAFAGLGWLTYLSSSLGRSLYPYNLIPGIVGEGALTIWLLVAGVPPAPRRHV